MQTKTGGYHLERHHKEVKKLFLPTRQSFLVFSIAKCCGTGTGMGGGETDRDGGRLLVAEKRRKN